MRSTLILIFAFALGSIPTGLWWARARGIDLRQVGSGNLGATNVYRALGARAGLLVLAIDILKGAAAVVAARVLAPQAMGDVGGGHAEIFGMSAGLPVAAAGAAVLGHIFTPLAGFRGGKGVATGAGAMLVIASTATLVAASVFALTVAATRYVSLGSVLAAASLPLAVALTQPREPGVGWASIIVALLVIARHRDNVKRLLSGTERRLEMPARGRAGNTRVR